jgi:Tol biopolymer transport system component
VEGGSPSTGTVTLSGAAPVGGASVSLSSSDASATVPASAVVAAGATTATFTVTTAAVTSPAVATLSASYGGATRTADLTIDPPPATLSSLALSLGTVEGGSPSTGTVTLSGAAPSGGASVSLSSSNASATVPASAVVAAGATTATFTVTTVAVTDAIVATISASYRGTEWSDELVVNPPAPPPVTLSSLTLDPASVPANGSSTGSVTLSGPAPAGGALVALSSSSAAATVPAWSSVAPGATAAVFTVTTSAMIATAATTITASYGGSSRTADLAIAPEPGCALRDPGAQWLGFSSSRSGSYDVYAIREDGTCLTRVTSDAGDDLFVTWSPAGTLAYASARSGTMRIYVLDFTTGAKVALDVGDLAATSPAFSPDGSTIAFEGHAPGVTALSDVYVVPAAGGTPVNLTGGTTYNAGPAWSPDGGTLYFVSNRTRAFDVWKVPSAGGASTQVTTASGILGRPAPTPDGAGIAYARSSEVVIQDVSGSPPGTPRVVSSQRDGEPTVDRTGTRMVVKSSRDGSPELWLLDVATGAAVAKLTSGPGLDGAPAFAPFP